MSDIAGVSWTRVGMTVPVTDARGMPGTSTTATVTTPDGASLTIGVCEWEDGRTDVRALRTSPADGEYARLLEGLRIGIDTHGDEWVMELTALGPTTTGTIGAVKASVDLLNGLAKRRYADTLVGFGVTRVGTKAQLLGARHARREYIAATMPQGALDAALACYVLCRVVPISRVVFTGGPWIPTTPESSPPIPRSVPTPASTPPKRPPARSDTGASTPVTGRSGLRPTGEQQAVIDRAGGRSDLVVEALAGTGKTSTLRMFAHASTGRRGQYVAFNRAIVNEAAASFPSTVSCKTAHQLAFASVGHRYAARLNGPRLTNEQLAEFLKCEPYQFRVGGTKHHLTAAQVARYALGTVRLFCKSVDPEITALHVPLPPLLDEDSAAAADFSTHIVNAAHATWTDLSNPNGVLPWNKNHDYYLKLWQLSGPTINVDYIMFDEAQDADPVMLTVVNDQDHAQLVYCGDDYQTLYEWRGAKNALALAPVDERLWLTQSFRFGDGIAAVANQLLQRLDAPHLIQGNPKHRSWTAKLTSPDAIVCRTNGAVIQELVDADQAGRRVAVLGGARELSALASACKELQMGRRTSHPDLAPFQTWNEVLEWIEENPEQAPDVAKDIKLITRFTPDGIKRVINTIVEEKDADVTISTVHQAKGREWRTVRLGTDFPHPDDMEPDELRVAYVAVTRARDTLDTNGLFIRKNPDTTPPHQKTTPGQSSTPPAPKKRPRITFPRGRRRYQ